jgi:heme oxygenase
LSGARSALRTATADEHARLDGLFERFDLSDRADYARFLTAHAAALPAVEQALDAAGMGQLMPDWSARRRTPLLLGDLADMGLPAPATLPQPVLPDAAACWGAAYVVEGSRLGGALLARSVAAELPRAYLGAAQPKGAWRDFLVQLEAALDTEEKLADATTSARATFRLFETAGSRQMERLAG